MDTLAKLERLVEGVVEGPFSLLQRGPLQPVQIAKRLARLMDEQAVLTVDQQFAPDLYLVLLSPTDAEQLAPLLESLERDFSLFLEETAQERGFGLKSPVSVTIQAAPEVPTGSLRVQASFRPLAAKAPKRSRSNATRQPTDRLNAAAVRQAVEHAGATASLAWTDASGNSVVLPVQKELVTLGRALDNDVVLEDERVSRYHAEIRRTSGRFYVRDLQSSNGTWLNGKCIQESLLRANDEVSLGRAVLRFSSVSRTTGSDAG